MKLHWYAVWLTLMNLAMSKKVNHRPGSSEELIDIVRHKRDVTNDDASATNIEIGANSTATETFPGSSKPDDVMHNNATASQNGTELYNETETNAIKNVASIPTPSQDDAILADADTPVTTDSSLMGDIEAPSSPTKGGEDVESSGDVDETVPQTPQLDSERLLVKQLMLNYTRSRPVRNWRDTVPVSVGLRLMHIVAVTTSTQSIQTIGRLEFTWKDEYLTWDVGDYDDMTQIVLPSSSVWLPDIAVANSMNSEVDTTWRNQPNILVTNTGVMTWVPTVKLDTKCWMVITNFPFDQHLCSIRIGTISSPDKQVNITTNTKYINGATYQENEEWEILHNTTRIECSKSYQEGTGTPLTFCKAVFEVMLDRRSSYYVLYLIIPALVLVIISILTFLIPVQSGERFNMGIIILLSFILLLIFTDSISGASRQIPIFGIYLIAFIILNALALTCTTIVYNQYHIQPLRPVPYWIRLIVLDCFGALCGNSGVRGKYVITSAPSLDRAERDKDRDGWIQLMQRTKADTVLPLESSQAESPSFSHNRRSISPSRENVHVVSETASVRHNNPELIKLNGIMCEILVEIRRARRDKVADETAEETREQWQAVAQILDNIFFTIFVIIFIVGILLFPCIILWF